MVPARLTERIEASRDDHLTVKTFIDEWIHTLTGERSLPPHQPKKSWRRPLVCARVSICTCFRMNPLQKRLVRHAVESTERIILGLRLAVSFSGL